jgi:predicted ester cyclase
MTSAVYEDARRRLTWPVTVREYDRIRRMWLKHAVAVERHDLDGLVETLTPDCVYEVVPTGQRWEQHAGARAFYSSLLGAFPDAQFALQEIVIGPQGVFEVARLTGTHQGVWAGIAPTGHAIVLTVMIYLAWDPESQRFEGEKVFFDRGEMDELLLR